MKAIAISFILFLAIFIPWRHAFPGGILFFQGLSLSIIIAIVHLLVVWRYKHLSFALASKEAFFCFLLIYSFVFTIPTTVERAYSVKMLGHIGDAPSGLSKAQIQQWYANDFLENGGVKKRLDEQTATGTIENADGQFQLTSFGKFLNKTFQWMRVIFACKN